MTKKLVLAALAVSLCAGVAVAADAVSPDVLQKVIASSWKEPDANNPAGVGPSWSGRLVQDDMQKICSETRNKPSKEQAAAISKAALASVKYPEDGKFLGDWKKGEKIAQEGKGLRYNDKPEDVGGNCYACHQIDPKELSYGTIGPSLKGYGKTLGFDEKAQKTVYEKIYNSHVSVACSNMPRFGTQGILTIENLKDVVALLMSPDSPVNK
ncbi:MAG: sulfur oxidation c-type cytochrome SoxX [Hyphomicrobiaceae bacterium]|nr:sulfur oxidation c-type cytochrome SoxX [Hyphomicrobiaceae bacterium]